MKELPKKGLNDLRGNSFLKQMGKKQKTQQKHLSQKQVVLTKQIVKRN